MYKCKQPRSQPFFSERSRSGASVTLVCGEINDFSGAARSGVGSFRSNAPKKKTLHMGASELVRTDYIPSGSLSRTIYPT